MTNNVANTSTFISTSTTSLPTAEELDGWNRKKVKGFLQEKKDELELKENDIDVIYDQRVSGRAFLRLNEEQLTHNSGPFKLPYGSASAITELIKQIKGKQPIVTAGTLTETADSVYIFIDNSNVNIQGKKVTAWCDGVNKNLVQIDYGRLVEMAQKGRPMGAVPVVVGSCPPPEDTLWMYLKNKLRYNVQVYDQNFLNQEKEVNSEISIRICDTIYSKYIPGTVILISGDGNYGPVIRRALNKNWTIEVWFWTDDLSSQLTKMDVRHPEYKAALALQTTIINLDDYYYKKFIFASEYNNIAELKYLLIFTDLVENSEIMKHYIAFDLFDWWYKPNNKDTLKLYVSTRSQWKEIKNLVMNKYPNAKETYYIGDTFFLEKNMYLSCLKHKVNSA